MFGFTYRGLHSIRDIGVVFKTVSRPIVAPPRITGEDVPYRDGSVDFSSENGRIYYDDKVLELQISIVDKNLPALHKKITKVVSWLVGGYADLIFDDMPFTVWRAMPINYDTIAPELARVGKTTVQFRCRPFNQAIFNNTGPMLGSNIPLGSDIRIGFGKESEFTLQNGRNELDLIYIGTAYARPKLVFSETTATSVTVTCNGRTISYSGDIANLIIDCEKYVCYQGGADDSANAQGEYFELSPNQPNQLTVTCNAPAHLQVIYDLSFYYGVTGL